MGWLTAAVFAASFGFYMLLAGSLTWTEAVAGLGSAAAVAAYAVIQRREQERRLALRLPPVRALASTAKSLVTDTARVGLALVRALAGGPRRGEAEWQRFHPGGRSPAETGRRALVTLLTSAAPNGFVIDIRPSAAPEAEHALLLHRLAPARPLSGRDWPA